jgi:hypothetical protein
MSETFWLRSVSEDRDLSRAASERYLMLQALSAPSDPATSSSRHRLLASWSRAVHLLRTRRAGLVGGAEDGRRHRLADRSDLA